jgi:hypothetical protein
MVVALLRRAAIMVAITTVDEPVRSLIRALAGLGLCALAGCAVSNEGAVD